MRLAQAARATEVTEKKEEAALVKTDPAPVKLVLWTIAGVLSGAAMATIAICGTGHCR